MKKLILIILSFIMVGLYSCTAVGSGGEYIIVSSTPLTKVSGNIDSNNNHLCNYMYVVNGVWRYHIDSIGKYKPGDDIRNKK